MNRLLEIGFEVAGHWLSEHGKLKFELTRHSTQENILYAFVCDGEVMYVGKTVQSLAQRMSGYRTPGKTQVTNVSNNRRISNVLASGATIDILALPDNGLMHYGKFHINLAAALEDDIIRKLKPKWNGGKSEEISDAELKPLETRELAQTFTKTFDFILQPTYFRSGFFNVSVSAQEQLGSDGETIELFLGDAHHPVLGTINRRANTNKTPRIFGGQALRDWFKKEGEEMDRVLVHVISPTSIRLKVCES